MYDIEKSSYQEIKADIKDDLKILAERFVIIGYRLKRIRDEKLYELDGYKTITEFAQEEYGLSQSETSRFIAINDKYSINGSSPKLLPQYEGYGKSKLSEMLNMSEEEMKLVTVQTTKAEIRDINREIKEVKKEAESANYAPAHNQESLENTQSESHFEENKNYIIPDAEKLIIEFFRPKTGREMLKELSELQSKDIHEKDREIKAAEIINPSGHFLFRNKLTILILGEDNLKYNKFGGTTTEYRYNDFLHDLLMVFDFGSRDPWVAFYGEPEPDPESVKVKEPEKKEPEKKETKDKPTGKPEPKKPEKPLSTQSITKKIDPKEKPVEISEDKDNQEQDEDLPGQMQMKDYPETAPKTEDNTSSDNNVDSKEDIQKCRICGCTDDHACEGGCYWVEDDLCSKCAEKLQQKQEEHIEIVDADIINTPKPEVIVLENEDGSKELQILVKGSQGIRIIRVINADTGESWEVTIN